MTRPTLRDIAKCAGVSHATASLVLNEKGNISEATRTRVKKVIYQMGYKRQPSSRVIGIIGAVPASLLAALKQASAEYGYDLETWPHNGAHTVGDPPEQMGGVIVYGGRWDPTWLDSISQQYPTVLHGSHSSTSAVDSIWVDNADAIFQAVNYLLGKGHRNIGFINGPKDTTTSWEKQSGFERAISLAGPPARGFMEMCESFGVKNARLATQRLLARAPEITALIIAEIPSGIATLDFLCDKGITVPRDMSLVVFRDDDRLLATDPPITAIGFSYLDIARDTLSHLVRRINDPDAHSKRILFKPYIIERDSVAEFRMA